MRSGRHLDVGGMGVGLGLEWEDFATGDGSKVGSMYIRLELVLCLSFSLSFGLTQS